MWNGNKNEKCDMNCATCSQEQQEHCLIVLKMGEMLGSLKEDLSPSAVGDAFGWLFDLVESGVSARYFWNGFSLN